MGVERPGSEKRLTPVVAQGVPAAPEGHTVTPANGTIFAELLVALVFANATSHLQVPITCALDDKESSVNATILPSQCKLRLRT